MRGQVSFHASDFRTKALNLLRDFLANIAVANDQPLRPQYLLKKVFSPLIGR